MLNQDFKEFLRLLNEFEVKYLVVGGYAVAFHGHPRYTKDLDVWAWVSPENASQLMKALKEFGFGALGLTEMDFQNPSNVIQLGYPPTRIDIAMSVSGLDFEPCYERRRETIIDGLPINFIDLEDLITNKRASGRGIDLDDVENLK
ncbi:MAG: nucleotidyltransferase [Lewinellaceae bacterium]|nr:nucleotidyltransferase [Lewinellaceae bacterium]